MKPGPPKVITDQHAYNQAYHRERRLRLRLLGLCRDCKAKTEGGKVLCVECSGFKHLKAKAKRETLTVCPN